MHNICALVFATTLSVMAGCTTNQRLDDESLPQGTLIMIDGKGGFAYVMAQPKLGQAIAVFGNGSEARVVARSGLYWIKVQFVGPPPSLDGWIRTKQAWIIPLATPERKAQI